MQLSEIQTEVKARVSDTASTTRLNYWINAAYRKAVEKEAWPFLETTTTGTSPLTISDLRAVIYVVDSTTKEVLDFADVRDLREADPTLIWTGSPYCWYQSSATVISAYPTNSSTSLSVRYLKVPADLSGSGDIPIIPTRYHYDLLVEGACVYAYRDSDNAELAESCKLAFDEALLDMTDALLVPNYDSARSLVPYGTDQ